MEHLEEFIHREFQTHWAAVWAGVVAFSFEPVAQEFEYVSMAKGHAVFDSALASN